MNTIYHCIAGFIAILIASYVVHGVTVTVVSALVLAVLLGVINMFFKPIIRLLTLPLNILTFGLFSFVVNAGIIMLLGMVVPDFVVANFWSALLFSILVSLVTAFFGAFLKKD